MTLVREPGSNILTQFIPPVKGTWLNTAAHTIPPDAVYNSNNIFIREGKTRTRPGLDAFASPFHLATSGPDTLNRHIIGGSFAVTPVGRIIFAVSLDTLFIYTGSANWGIHQTVPGTPFANSTADVVDVAYAESGGTQVILFANEDYVLKEYTFGGAPIEIIGTNIPTARSICIAASRVIALLTNGQTIVWSNVNNYTVFDALAYTIRSQRTDIGICVRTLSALTFVLYKENSIHVARAQAGLDEGTAFSFSEPIVVEGPAGVYAVVDVEGTHIYMTRSGRIGIFNGTSRPQWIADGIWFFLQNDINQEYSHLIRAIYDYRLNIIIFVYPKGSETVTMTGIVIINLPFMGIETQTNLVPYCFLGQFTKSITHASTRRLLNEVEQSIIYAVPGAPATTNIYDLLETATSDDGTAFNCSFQTGLYAAPDASHMQITTESFFERATDYGAVTLEVVTSDSLDTVSGNIQTADAQVISLETPVVNEYIGFNKIARFFGLRYSWTSVDIIRHSGTVVYSSTNNRQRK